MDCHNELDSFFWRWDWPSGKPLQKTMEKSQLWVNQLHFYGPFSSIFNRKTVSLPEASSMSGWWFGCHIFMFPYIGNFKHPNWLTHIFQRGSTPTTNQMSMCVSVLLGFSPWRRPRRFFWSTGRLVRGGVFSLWRGRRRSVGIRLVRLPFSLKTRHVISMFIYLMDLEGVQSLLWKTDVWEKDKKVCWANCDHKFSGCWVSSCIILVWWLSMSRCIALKQFEWSRNPMWWFPESYGYPQSSFILVEFSLKKIIQLLGDPHDELESPDCLSGIWKCIGYPWRRVFSQGPTAVSKHFVYDISNLCQLCSKLESWQKTCCMYHYILYSYHCM